MKKYHGTKNRGFTQANVNRTERAILNARREGRSPKTDKRLAQMMDRLYGTDFLTHYHQEDAE